MPTVHMYMFHYYYKIMKAFRERREREEEGGKEGEREKERGGKRGRDRRRDKKKYRVAQEER